MEFMEYSNKTQSNIIPQKEFESLVQEVFGVISDALCKSLGPLGSSTTILNGMQTDATKDGFSILKKLCFHNRYKKMIYNLILAPCTKTNNTVGDGTSTTIALTKALFSGYKSSEHVFETMYRLPRQFTRAWDECIDKITKYIKEKSVIIDPSDYETIYNIAYVSSNGNVEISKAIAETYQKAKSPNIKQKDSPTNKSYIKEIDGFEFPTNLISDAFIRNEDLTAEEENISTMIFDHKIETDVFKTLIVPINNVFRAKGKKLLIIAPFYDKYMCDTVVDQYITYEFREFKSNNLILSQYAIGKLDDHQLQDLATVLRSKVINQELCKGMIKELTDSGNNIDVMVDKILNDPEYNFTRMIGTAAHSLLSCTNGSIFKVENITEDKEYCEILERAKKELEDIKGQTNFERQSYAAKIYKANARLLQLEMKNYIYYIGADSALQKNIIWDSVEDVIKCVRSATENGIVPGCQLTIISACNNFINEILKGHDEESYQISSEDSLKVSIYTLIHSAVTDVYLDILHGPERTGMIKLQSNWFQVPKDKVGELSKLAMDRASEIVKKSVELNQVFDLETLKYSDKIVTSAETDWMVLSAASELVKILISGNQCVFLDADVNESHQEDVEVYV